MLMSRISRIDPRRQETIRSGDSGVMLRCVENHSGFGFQARLRLLKTELRV